MEKHPATFTQATVIINPSRKPAHARRLERMLSEYGNPVIVSTESKEHFIEEIHRFYDSSSPYLLVAGGDGTVHDAINTLMKLKAEKPGERPVHLGFFRGGSGNGYQDSYEIPENLRAQVETFVHSIENNHCLTVDLLKYQTAEEEGYGQLAGTGFDAHVLYKREKRKIRRRSGKVITKPGIVSYIAAILQTYILYNPFKSQQFMVRLTGGKYSYRGPRVNAEYAFDTLTRRAAPGMIEVGKRPYFAKQFKICPDTVCNDGTLDAYLFNMKDKMKIVLDFLSLWNGWHDQINFRYLQKGRPAPIERYEVSRVEISSASPFHYHIDGELKETSTPSGEGCTLAIDIVPKAMSFIVPYMLIRKFHPF